MKPPGHVIISFLGAFVITTAINVVLWQFVAANLYDCGDEAIPGYLEPGHWVHSVNGRSITTVPHIVHNRDMNEPDTIKEGWTVGRLLVLWSLLFTASVVVSLALALVPLTPRKKANQSPEQNDGQN